MAKEEGEALLFVELFAGSSPAAAVKSYQNSSGELFHSQPLNSLSLFTVRLLQHDVNIREVFNTSIQLSGLPSRLYSDISFSKTVKQLKTWKKELRYYSDQLVMIRLI